LERLKDLLIRKGFLRVLINEDIVALENEDFHFANENQVYVIVDRLALKADLRQRIADALETAYQEGDGQLAIWTMESIFLNSATEQAASASRLHKFSRKFECSHCDITYIEPEPRLFSFNNPYGACPECHGFGDKMSWDLNLIIPNWKKSIRECEILPWNTPKSQGIVQQLARIAPRYGFTLETPWSSFLVNNWPDYRGQCRIYRFVSIL
jgi:excinuclease ABC subunit A